LRYGKQKLRSRRSVKRAQKRIIPQESYQPSQLSFSEDSPPLPPRETFAAALLVDAETGETLFSLNDHREWPTASLAKMMVALLTFEAMARGEVSLHAPIPISKRASNEGGRKVHLRPGEEFSLEELLQAMMVTSANDAAVAIAEHLYGSVEACVAAMNRRARQLGMTDTLYRTPNGLPLPDGTPPDLSSAADQAILARALAKHHLLFEWTSLNRVPFREGRTSLPNTNRLVGQVSGVDGLKTGFTIKARYNLVTTAQRGSLRLIAVVLGGRSSGLRFLTAANLLEWGFTNYTRLNVIKSGKPLGQIRIEQGSISTLHPIAARNASLLLRKADIEDLKIVFQAPSVISAPITRDQILGQVLIRNNDRTVAVIPAVSPFDVPRAHWFPARH
jgi:D-alanyl-D-alanine carboxypeptidase (penicillin-binding protein 5/6)